MVSVMRSSMVRLTWAAEPAGRFGDCDASYVYTRTYVQAETLDQGDPCLSTLAANRALRKLLQLDSSVRFAGGPLT